VMRLVPPQLRLDRLARGEETFPVYGAECALCA